MNGQDTTLVEVLQTAEITPNKAKVVDICTGSEDEENVTAHQEAAIRTLDCMEYNSAESHHLLPEVSSGANHL